MLRGSLLERMARHIKDCRKWARGEGHHVFVLTVSLLAQARRSDQMKDSLLQCMSLFLALSVNSD